MHQHMQTRSITPTISKFIPFLDTIVMEEKSIATLKSFFPFVSKSTRNNFATVLRDELTTRNIA
jgi:hypothetical protein